MSGKDKKNKIASYISNEQLAKHDGDRPVVSSLLKNIFLPLNRVPKQIVDQMVTDREMLQKQLLAEEPLTSLTVAEPYWSKGKNVRDYSEVRISIYGSLALADDRHCLDCIVAHGSLLEGAENTTVRQFAEQDALMNVDWDRFEDQSQINAPLSNRGVYFHIPVNVLLKSMNLKPGKNNRKNLLARLQRLSVMTLVIDFLKDGKVIPNRTKRLSLIDKDYYKFLDWKKIKNKSAVVDSSDTFTDLLINVSSFYLNSLSTEGKISRERFMKDYPVLVGKNSVVDFYKWIDEHNRAFVHQKWLSEMVSRYLSEKVGLFGTNKHKKTTEIMAEVIEHPVRLKSKYKIALRREPSGPSAIGRIDMRMIYLPKLEENN